MPAEAAERAVQCPRCHEWITTEHAQNKQVEEAAKQWRDLVRVFSVALLLGGLAVLCGCWLYDKGQGMMGGGFLAVVGAILVSRK